MIIISRNFMRIKCALLHHSWDPVFQPDGHDGTFAELSSAVKNKISHRYRSLDALRQYMGEHFESIKQQIEDAGQGAKERK